MISLISVELCESSLFLSVIKECRNSLLFVFCLHFIVGNRSIKICKKKKLPRERQPHIWFDLVV